MGCLIKNEAAYKHLVLHITGSIFILFNREEKSRWSSFKMFKITDK